MGLDRLVSASLRPRVTVQSLYQTIRLYRWLMRGVSGMEAYLQGLLLPSALTIATAREAFGELSRHKVESPTPSELQQLNSLLNTLVRESLVLQDHILSGRVGSVDDQTLFGWRFTLSQSIANVILPLINNLGPIPIHVLISSLTRLSQDIATVNQQVSGRTRLLRFNARHVYNRGRTLLSAVIIGTPMFVVVNVVGIFARQFLPQINLQHDLVMVVANQLNIVPETAQNMFYGGIADFSGPVPSYRGSTAFTRFGNVVTTDLRYLADFVPYLPLGLAIMFQVMGNELLNSPEAVVAVFGTITAYAAFRAIYIVFRSLGARLRGLPHVRGEAAVSQLGGLLVHVNSLLNVIDLSSESVQEVFEEEDE